MEIGKLKTSLDTAVLDNLMIGRVYPHIYAFSTNTVPKYWKVGDTVRPVEIRLSEWRKHYQDLTKEYSRAAKIGDKFFRDYAIHSYLERELGKERLQRENMPAGLYYSNEFFKDVNADNIEEAFNHIEQDAVHGGGVYQLYNEQHLPEIQHYERDTEPYKLRPNQDDAVKAFMAAKEKGRTKLLMYAVMRFGKSFTSMCCANAMDAKIVVIVSGKADVKEEWKKTVEKIANFDGFVFLDGEQLSRDENIIKSNIDGGKRVAIFLTLQDLQGDEIKDKHKEVFGSQIDLLIVDETHYGARASEYGKVLQSAGLTKAQIKNELKQNDIESVEDIDKEVQKHLNAKITLHLSGTPYRILMSREFSEDDIVSFCQFTDIIDASDKWIEENNQKEEPKDEWENPYYGFPQMIRFAFTPNKSSLQKIKQLKEMGKTATLSALFRPQSIDKDAAGNYKKFENESEVCDLLRAIDGSQEDENIFSFLNYDKVKQGEMCHHMVFVLPYRASCDAMQELITNNPDKFDNLSQYEIINIAGVDGNTSYPSVETIKSKIKRCESEGKKTITLTVNRMLTGNTVEEWDTMIFLKDTASPQEYDQAIFRLQNQYVVTYENAEGRTIKYNKKPQTLLVDFDVDRMFRLQELKSQFYNANTDANGNEKLEARLRRELEISPIICLNKDKLHQVTCANIMDAVREYSQSRSVMDEATDIPVDEIILTDDEILSIIRDLIPIDSKKGITFKPTEGDDDMDTNGENDTDADGGDQPNAQDDSQGGDDTETQSQPSQDEAIELAKKLQTYYLQILFFAFLTESKVHNLRDVIDVLSANDDNKRIAKNLGLDRDKLNTLHSKCSHFIHSKLDYKIENINNLICDETMEPAKRAEVALTQFGRMSDSEIVTPKNIAAEMIAMLPKMENLSEVKFLDIASKQGEFAYAIYDRFTKTDDAVKNKIYSLPTSPLCYEFTRKIYKLLGMPVENIIADFTTYDLIKENNEEKIKRINDMKFNVIVGNPPYQEVVAQKETSNGQKRSINIFQHFQTISDKLGTYTSLIYPGARWIHRSGKGLEQFGLCQINDSHLYLLKYYPNSGEIFKEVGIADGISIVMKNMHKEYGGFKYIYSIAGNEISVDVDNPGNILFPLNPLDEEISLCLNNMISKYSSLHESILSQKLFSIESDFVEKNPTLVREYNEGDSFDKETEIKLYTNDKAGKSGRSRWYIANRNIIKTGIEYINKWKVIVSSANAGGQKRSNQIAVVDNYSAFGRSRVALKTFDTEQEAQNFFKYATSEIIRFAFLLTDESLTSLAKKVPDLLNYTDDNGMIDYNGDVNDQLYELFGIDEKNQLYIKNVLSKHNS